MILLLLSILSSTTIYVLFKFFGSWKLKTFQAIVANYLIAALFGIANAGGSFDGNNILNEPWIPMGILTGVLFISLFYLMAYTSQVYGVSSTSIASKMSMLIPVTWFVIVDPDETLNLIKIIAIALGTIAVILATAKKKKTEKVSSIAWLLVVLFIGTGALDLVLAYTEKFMLLTKNDRIQFTAIPFITAFSVGVVLLAVKLFRGSEKLHVISLLAGVGLGIVNYASIYFLLGALGSGFMIRSATLPANNMGIVAASAIAGVVIFRERLSEKNIAGILLALASIALLIFETV
jgi:drug/metabolite transporter (DMT)-like permease